MLKTKADDRAIAEGGYFDEHAANRVRKFFGGFLRHSKGQFAGQYFNLLPWQWDDVIRPLFGWKQADGTRRFRKAFIEIPKKNGKSTLCAGISLYMLLGDNERGSEVYSAASDREQASIVFNEAVNMVTSSSALTRLLRIKRAAKRIEYGTCVYKALSADVPTKEGLNIHALIFDELHAQPNRKLWDTLKYGGAARRQPLTIVITTAGYDKLSICYEEYKKAKAVLDGTSDDPSLFAYIAEADEAKWEDEDEWRRANPSWGSTINPAAFKADYEEAKQSETQKATFKRYRLNIWTEGETRFVDMDKWDLCGREVYGPAPLSQLGAFGGLDLASTTDIASFVLWFPDAKQLRSWFWVPHHAIGRRRRQQRHRIDHWVRAGLIKATDGDVIDYDVIRADISDLAKQYDIKAIAIDRWNSTQLQTQLLDDGFEVIKFGQGYASMAAPMRELDRLITAGSLWHGGNPVMRWMMSNLCAECDPAGNWKPSKKKSGEKIDGCVSLLMAMGQAMVSGDGDSLYEKKGVMVFDASEKGKKQQGNLAKH